MKTSEVISKNTRKRSLKTHTHTRIHIFVKIGASVMKTAYKNCHEEVKSSVKVTNY